MTSQKKAEPEDPLAVFENCIETETSANLKRVLGKPIILPRWLHLSLEG
jgi:hypothetical protein